MAIKYDIFYAFSSLEPTLAAEENYAEEEIVPKPRCTIQFAADKHGTRLGNYNAGEKKINEITWNDHFYQGWSHFLDDNGTWKRGKKTAGRMARREVLLQYYLDLDFVDPYPDGKPEATGLHRRVNNIFPGKGHVPAFECNPENRLAQQNANQVEEPELFLPGTKILVSSSGVKQNAFSELDSDPTNIVAEFLKNKYPATGRHIRDYEPIDHIESAFFKIGYRINREAAFQASRWASRGTGRCVLDCKAWKKALPYRLHTAVNDDYGIVVARVRKEFEEAKQERRRNDSLPVYRIKKRGSQDRPIQLLQSATPSRTPSMSPSVSLVPDDDDEKAQQDQRALPTTYSSNTTFPGTQIDCEPRGISFNAYKEVSQSATSVIHDYLSGRLIANKTDGKHTTLAQIESAFYKKGIRIDRWAASKASLLVRDGKAESVLDTLPWQQNQPIKLNPEKFNAVDNLLCDRELNGGLFMYETSDDEN